MTFKIANQDVHTEQANQKSFLTKRQHCCDPQCSSINKYFDGHNAAGYTIMGWPCPDVGGNT